jgi:hypothetical protein
MYIGEQLDYFITFYVTLTCVPTGASKKILPIVLVIISRFSKVKIPHENNITKLFDELQKKLRRCIQRKNMFCKINPTATIAKKLLALERKP